MSQPKDFKQTVGAFVSGLKVSPVETSIYGDELQSWLPSNEWIEVHTGLGTFDVPWPMGKPMPPVGTNVRLTIEWETHLETV